MSGRTVDELADSYWHFLLERDPVLRSRQGLPIETIPGVGEDTIDTRARFARSVLDELASVEAARQTPRDADTAAFLAGLAEMELLQQQHYWLTPTATPYTLLPITLFGSAVFEPFRFAEAIDVDRYLDLVRDLAGFVRSVVAKVSSQAKRGFRVPVPALPGAIETIQRVRVAVARYVQVSDQRTGELNTAARGRLRDGIAAVRSDALEPAFDALLGTLDDASYRGSAPEQVGWAVYRGGEAAYRAFARGHTTSDVTPEELHRIGVAHCVTTSEQIREIRAALNFSGTDDEFREYLNTEPRVHASSPKQVEQRYQNYLARLEPLLPKWFATLPKTPYGVARLEPELERSLTFGYYERPTLHRPVGRYRYNASDLANRSLLDAAALIYHELVPGHHFHLARQAENAELPPARREILAFTGFNEGWAEYAADLGWEMGLYDDPWDAMGRLANERFAAQRLVVDTGLNLGTMTIDEARGFMRANSMQSDAQLGTDLLRYATDLPGQALTYHTGLEEFRRLRTDAQARSGTRFDVRAFHEAVLAGGALPFPALRERVIRELDSIAS